MKTNNLLKNIGSTIIYTIQSILFAILLFAFALFGFIVYPLHIIFHLSNKFIITKVTHKIISNYNIDINYNRCNDDNVIIDTPLKQVIIKTPHYIFQYNKFIKQLKKSKISLDNIYSGDFLLSYNTISEIKKTNTSIIYSLEKYPGILKNIHLYNINGLSEKEMDFLFSLNLSDTQKILLERKINS